MQSTLDISRRVAQWKVDEKISEHISEQQIIGAESSNENKEFILKM